MLCVNRIHMWSIMPIHHNYLAKNNIKLVVVKYDTEDIELYINEKLC